MYNSTLDATTQPPGCLQTPSSGIAGGGQEDFSEDCLYLNVFTPAGANAQTAFLPVMVWM
jgi:carboxylesterase type B